MSYIVTSLTCSSCGTVLTFGAEEQGIAVSRNRSGVHGFSVHHMDTKSRKQEGLVPYSNRSTRRSLYPSICDDCLVRSGAPLETGTEAPLCCTQCYNTAPMRGKR